MLRNTMMATLLAMVSVASAVADDWSGVPANGGITQPGGAVSPKASLLGTEGIAVTCNDNGFEYAPICDNGPAHYEFAYVPLSAFARSDRLDAVANSVNNISLGLADMGAIISEIQAAAIDFKEHVDGEMAASTSLVVLTPSAPGKTTMHLGYGHFGDQGAVGFTAAH